MRVALQRDGNMGSKRTRLSLLQTSTVGNLLSDVGTKPKPNIG